MVDPNAEMKNNTALTINTGLRPNRSPNPPATSVSAMQPTIAELVNQPASNSRKWNCAVPDQHQITERIFFAGAMALRGVWQIVH